MKFYTMSEIQNCDNIMHMMYRVEEQKMPVEF